MIESGSFYSKKDTPNKKIQERLWHSIADRITPTAAGPKKSFDRMSFLYGIAASFVVMFTCIGVYSTYRQVADVSLPQEIKTDKAYQSAIREFESVVYAKPNSASSERNNRNVLRKKQLNFLDDAINELRQETNSHDLSPLKRQRLHELYNLKLSLLQEILQQGELEL